jgi:hypothetical protein
MLTPISRKEVRNSEAVWLIILPAAKQAHTNPQLLHRSAFLLNGDEQPSFQTDFNFRPVASRGVSALAAIPYVFLTPWRIETGTPNDPSILEIHDKSRGRPSPQLKKLDK